MVYSNADGKSLSVLPSLVCYADILGFENMTKRAFENDKEDDFLRKVKSSLDSAYEEIQGYASPGDTGHPFLDLKFFTDDIVVGYPLRDPVGDDAEIEFGTLMTLFAESQKRLALDGFLIRGAITIGRHYQDDDIAYGDALLEAVDLSKSGKPPRLVVGTSVEPWILLQLSAYGDGPAPHHDELLEDPCDGLLYVNYLGAAFAYFPEEGIDYQLLEGHKEMVYRGLQEHESDESVYRKYAWLAAYHNYVCRTFAEALLAANPIGLYADEIDLNAVAQNVLAKELPFDFKPSPLPFDLQRLKQRLGMT